MEKDRERPQSSPTRIADLWEHACLLFHSFEWQSAADAFPELEQYTSDTGEKCIFALNRGLIEARLGDSDLALASFAKALETEKKNAVAHFLLGLMHAENGNYVDGLTHFEHCLTSLDSNTRHYRTSAGYFQLERGVVLYNADRMRLAIAGKNNQVRHIQPRLQTIPAQIIFEAPLRSTDKSETDGRLSTGVVHDVESRVNIDERVQDPVSRALKPIYSNGHDVKSLHLVGDQDMNLIVAPSNGALNTPRTRPRLAPRDARTRGGSMREMAQFLRYAGPSGDSTVSVDRNYMQRLLQNANDSHATSHTRGQASIASITSGQRDSLAHQDEDFESLFGLYDGLPSERRFLPLDLEASAPGPTVDDESTGIGRANTTAIDRTNPPMPRRPSLAEWWLHKEVSPPWLHKPVISHPTGADTQDFRNHAQTTWPYDERSLRSVPSVVSSTDFFSIGQRMARR